MILVYFNLKLLDILWVLKDNIYNKKKHVQKFDPKIRVKQVLQEIGF